MVGTSVIPPKSSGIFLTPSSATASWQALLPHPPSLLLPPSFLAPTNEDPEREHFLFLLPITKKRERPQEEEEAETEEEMKPILRKDGVCGGNGGNGGASPPLPLACFEMKPFIATLVVLTLLMAMWQLQPYESLLSSRLSSCPLPNSTSPLSKSKLSASPVPPVSTPIPTIQKAPVFTPPPDPNKRDFRAYGGAASLFVEMGAYRGGAATFAVVGLASKPTHVFGTPWFKCEWVSNNPSAAPVRAKAYKILPDWGYGRVYTVVVVNCTFPSNPNADNAGGKLLLHAYYSTTSRRYEKFVALEESPGSYDESHYRPPFRYEYLYCGSSLYGNLSASRIREWIAYHAYFFGPNSHFVFHDAGGVSSEVKAVLEPWVKAGRATVQDIRAQAEYDGYYYNQFLVVNDCLHRYRYAANWTFFFDVDEYLYVPNGRTLASVLDKLSGYTQFTIEQNPMSSKLCGLDPKKDYSKEWGFEKLVFRNSITGVRRDRKYAIQARKAYATGVHMSQNVIGKTTHKTEDMIRYYHYHNSINVLGEPCREFIPLPPKGNVTWFEKIPYVYDDNMKRIAGTIKQFEKETIGSIRT